MQLTNLNAQAIILLTAYFNKGDNPLTTTEYSKFAEWLMSKKLMPADLLDSDAQMSLSEWQDKKITHERILQLLCRGNAMAIAMQKWSNAGIWIITRADEEYPKQLKKRLGKKAPPIFYGAGDKKILRTRGVAIVGSRDASEEDLNFAHELGKKVAQCGYSVISGGARGVDEASMMGSIEIEGTTIGIVADGLMQKVLSKKYRSALMKSELVLLSPYYPEARFTVGNAMGRNKYIYTMADAAIVVQTGLKGGTWEGAKENLKHQWVPLFVKENNKADSGSSKLIEMGGKKLDESILDQNNLEFLFAKVENTVKLNMAEKVPSLDKRILDLLEKERLTIKAIAKKLSEDEKTVKKYVTSLIKVGLVQKHPNRPLQFSKIMKLPGME